MLIIGISFLYLYLEVTDTCILNGIVCVFPYVES